MSLIAYVLGNCLLSSSEADTSNSDPRFSNWLRAPMYDRSCPDYVVDCVEVRSGDTIVVEDQAGTRKSVRIYGIDAPETDQPHGPAATEALRSAAEGKRVEVEIVDEDRSGQIVGRVRPGRTSLGPLLVRNGHAWHDHRQAPEADTLAALQREARSKGRGLWAHANPVPPWEHRGRGFGVGTAARQLVEFVASVVRSRSGHDGPVVSID